MLTAALPACLPPVCWLPPAASGVIFNYMGAAVNWHEMPGIIYIGHFRDVKPQFQGK